MLKLIYCYGWPWLIDLMHNLFNMDIVYVLNEDNTEAYRLEKWM